MSCEHELNRIAELLEEKRLLQSLNAELLAALKRMLALWDGDESEVLDEHGAANATRAAIAKAEGRGTTEQMQREAAPVGQMTAQQYERASFPVAEQKAEGRE